MGVSSSSDADSLAEVHGTETLATKVSSDETAAGAPASVCDRGDLFDKRLMIAPPPAASGESAKVVQQPLGPLSDRGLGCLPEKPQAASIRKTSPRKQSPTGGR